MCLLSSLELPISKEGDLYIYLYSHALSSELLKAYPHKIDRKCGVHWGRVEPPESLKLVAIGGPMRWSLTAPNRVIMATKAKIGEFPWFLA